MKIRVNKDFLREYKDDAWKGFSGKEVMTLLLAAGTAIALVFLLHMGLGIAPAVAVYLSVPAASPIVLLGFYRYQGYLSPIRLLREIYYTYKAKELPYAAEETRNKVHLFQMQKTEGKKEEGNMAVLHAIRNFQKSARLTQPLFRIPKCVRQAFQIYRIYADGIFQLEDRKGKEKDLYDRAYLFADMNYINKNDEEKREVLMALMQFLNAMNADFKITAMNVSRNTEQYLDGLYREQNREAYPEVSKGMREWREELEQRGSMGDVNRLLYLTVTVRALRYTDAKNVFFFSGNPVGRGCFRHLIAVSFRFRRGSDWQLLVLFSVGRNR